jgi:ABC-type nitrate/sulfonate/bicarbonate transport system substrate-binding protein
MELRASTDENLNLARKIHEEIARSVAEERQIRDSMYELVVAYQELAKQLTDNAQQAGEIRQKLVDGTVRAERFMNEDMSRMLQQRAQEATNDFYQESKDHYNDLFKAAVRRYKQFTEAVMDFQDKIADESARRVRTIESKLGMVQKVSYGCIVLLLINLVVAILFKVF